MHARLKNLKLDRPLDFLDAETTGLDPGLDRIVEVGVLKYVPDEDPGRFHQCREAGQVIPFRHRLDPGIPIPPGATAIQGITDAEVAGRPTFRAIARQPARTL